MCDCVKFRPDDFANAMLHPCGLVERTLMILLPRDHLYLSFFLYFIRAAIKKKASNSIHTLAVTS